MNDSLDDKIKQALTKGTDSAAGLGGEVLDRINKRIESGKDIEEKLANHKGNTWRKWGIGTAAAVLVVTFFTFTQPGQAAVGKIAGYFAPQKKITQELEGVKEEKTVTLHENEKGYVIYIDEEYYRLDSSSGKDRIVPKAKAENVPEVYMEIDQVKDRNPESIANELAAQLEPEFKRVDNMETVDKPLKAIFIYAGGGSKWNDTVEKYYLVDNDAGGTFIIKQKLFLEASEGHGARFDNMLKEFKVVNKQ